MKGHVAQWYRSPLNGYRLLVHFLVWYQIQSLLLRFIRAWRCLGCLSPVEAWGRVLELAIQIPRSDSCICPTWMCRKGKGYFDKIMTQHVLFDLKGWQLRALQCYKYQVGRKKFKSMHWDRSASHYLVISPLISVLEVVATSVKDKRLLNISWPPTNTNDLECLYWAFVFLVGTLEASLHPQLLFLAITCRAW